MLRRPCPPVPHVHYTPLHPALRPPNQGGAALPPCSAPEARCAAAAPPPLPNPLP